MNTSNSASTQHSNQQLFRFVIRSCIRPSKNTSRIATLSMSLTTNRVSRSSGGITVAIFFISECEEKIKSIYEDTENFEEQEKALTATLARLDENLEEKRNHHAQLVSRFRESILDGENTSFGYVRKWNYLLHAAKSFCIHFHFLDFTN